MNGNLGRHGKRLGALMAVGLGLLALCQTAVARDADSEASVKLKVEVDRKVVLSGKKQPVFVLIEFDVAKVKPKPGRTRPHLNLGLVIDRSGSMHDKGKIEYARKAAKTVVDRLTSADRLAVVEYDDRITVLWPSSMVESPDMIKRRIDKLRPRGSTNLTGGMMKGVSEVLKNVDSDRINRVILLSDGLANQGITNPVEIKRLVRRSKQKGVTITTMGLGLHYNENLMQAIAENGGGTYYFIEGPTQMTRIFQEEMKTLFTTVAKDVQLTFKGSEVVEGIKVFGYSSDIAGRTARTSMESFYSEEERSLLLRIEIAPQKDGPFKLGSLQFTYLDCIDNAPKKVGVDLELSASPSQKLVDASRNKHVVVESSLIEAEQHHEDYVRQFEHGRKHEAKKNIVALADKLDKLNKVYPDVKVAKKVEALRMETQEMKQAARTPQARSRYLKVSKKRAYSAKKGKRAVYLLKEGDKGYEVERLQKALKARKLYSGPVNGRFTPSLTVAVRQFQRKNHISVDGVAGPQTLKALALY